MKISLFTVSFAGFWGQHSLTLEESIDQAADLGFAGVEIMGKRPHLSPLDYSIDDCKRLRERMEQRGIALSAIAAYTNFTGGAEAAEVPFVDFQIDYVGQLAQFTQALGGDLVRIFTSYERDDMPFAAQWQKTVSAIRQCADRAAAYGVTVGVQNHHDIGVDSKTLQELLRQVNRPNVIPMVDCWSTYLRGEDVAVGASMMGSAMRFTTVADYVQLPRSRYQPDLVNYQKAEPPFCVAVPMGEGELEYKRFFDALQKQGFDGWVSYEMCSPVRDGGELSTLRRYAKQFQKFMSDWTTKDSSF